MSIESVRQFKVEHREEERMLCSLLFGIIMWFRSGMLGMVFVDAGLVRPVNRGGVRLGLQEDIYIGFLDGHGEVVVQKC